MKRFIKRSWEIFCDCIFTAHCPYCEKVIPIGGYVCEKCKSKFPDNSITEYAMGGYKCACAFPYTSQFKNAVISFKFCNCGVYAKSFAITLTKAINEIFPDESFDIITCVPMHKNAEIDRGYNQARLLARECAFRMNLHYDDLLEKFKENKPQHSLKAGERLRNVKGVYRIRKKADVKGKNILIIDDIITTGNTLGECARILKKAGCRRIYCAALCTR